MSVWVGVRRRGGLGSHPLQKWDSDISEISWEGVAGRERERGGEVDGSAVRVREGWKLRAVSVRVRVSVTY